MAPTDSPFISNYFHSCSTNCLCIGTWNESYISSQGSWYYSWSSQAKEKLFSNVWVKHLITILIILESSNDHIFITFSEIYILSCFKIKLESINTQYVSETYNLKPYIYRSRWQQRTLSYHIYNHLKSAKSLNLIDNFIWLNNQS